MAILNVADYIAPIDAEGDLVPACRRVIEALEDGDTMLLPPGEFELLPETAIQAALPISNHDLCVRSLGLFFEDQHHICIDGNGATLYAHGIIAPLWFENCTNITIKNVQIDRRSPFDGNGIVTAVNNDDTDPYVDLLLKPESNADYFIHNGILTFQGNGWRQQLDQIFEFDTVEKVPATHSADNLGGNWQVQWRVEDLGNHQIRVRGQYSHTPKVGNIVVLHCAKRYCPAVTMSSCENMRCENVSIYAAGGMGFIAQRTKNITLSHCRVTPNPRGTRIDAACFDASHFANCAGQITVEHCTFHNQLDDPVNCHGAYFPVIRALDEYSFRVELRHPQQAGAPVADVGDVVALIRESNLERYWQGTVTHVKIVNQISVDLFFAEAIPEDLIAGDALDNISWYPDLTIRHCHFKGSRARGPLISTSGTVIVEDNYLRLPGAAILIVGGLDSWCESGPVTDVTIRRNHFDRCAYNAPIWGNAVIQLECNAKDITSRQAAFHQHIRIEDNIFDCVHQHILKTRSVADVQVKNNTINSVNGAVLDDWVSSADGDDVTCQDNSIG